jgi:tetratricopeptide (TPR) repeat protein
MAAGNPPQLALSEAQRQTLKAWLAEFARSWDEGRLAARVRQLPPPGDPLRRPALIEMVKFDLGKQWQRGRRLGVEAYLKTYPELGGTDAAPADLLYAEYQARVRGSAPADLNEFARRFPRQADMLRRLVDQASATLACPPVAESDQQTLAPFPSTPAPTFPGASPGSLPEHFGRYRILRMLGQGGMGTVYLAHDTQLDRPVALKVPHFGGNADPAALGRFYREARAAATIEHPNICPVHDYGEIDGIPYLTMGYIEGKPLAEFIRLNKPLPQRTVAALVRKLALALQEAHAHGVIHRDLKPANIMLNQRREPVIMDFGLARRLTQEDVRITKQGAILGTPAYMAPEQVERGGEDLGPACDIYTLGVILYELLTHQLPFQGELISLVGQVLHKQPPPPSRHRPDLDRALEAICLKAMAKDPGARYRSMTEFAAALTEYLRQDNPASGKLPSAGPVDRTEALPFEAVPPPPKPDVAPVAPRRRPHKPKARRPAVPLWFWVAGAGAAALVLVATVAVIIFLRPGKGGAHPAATNPGPAGVQHDNPVFHQGVAALAKKDYDLAISCFEECLRADAKDALAYAYRGDAYAGKGDSDKALSDYADALRVNPNYAKAYTGRGLVALTKYETDKAVAAFTDALKADPRYAPALAHRAGAYLRLRDYDRAQADCEAALKLDPRLALALAYRGWARACQTDTASAFTDCEAALKLDPELAAAHTARGIAHLTEKQYDEAAAELAEALRLDPKAAAAWYYRSLVHSARGEYDQALADASEALGRDPHFAPALYHRGEIYRLKKDYAKAVDDLAAAIKAEPTYAPAYQGRGAAYYAQGDYDRALTDFSEAIRLDPKGPAGYLARGATFAAKGQHAKAVEDFTAATDLSPFLPPAYANRGASYLALGNLDQAINDCTQAIRLNAAFAAPYRDRAQAYLRKKEYAPAVADCDAALKLEPNNAQAHATRGAAEAELGEFDKALKDLAEAARLDPKLAAAYPASAAKAYLGRATACYARGEHDQAVADYGEAIKLDAKNPAAYYGRGFVYKEKGKYDEAIADFNEAIKLDPKYAWAYFQRGLAYGKKGDQARAKADQEKAVQLDPKLADK